MGSTIRGLHDGMAAGAIAALIQTLIIWALYRVGIIFLIGVPLDFPLSTALIYQRVVWGGLWGMCFMLPLLKNSAQWKRGLVIGLLPAAASLFWFNPFLKGQGMLGLNLGPMMPVIVVAFNLLWGYLAGVWFGHSTPAGELPQTGSAAARET